MTSLLDVGLAMEPGLRQGVSAEVIQGVELLALAADDFDAVVDDAVARNPALERRQFRDAQAAFPADWPAPSDPRNELLRMVGCELGGRVGWLAAWIVESVDDHGLLGANVCELAEWHRVPEGEVGAALAFLRQRTSPAFAAADVRSCLLLQLALLDNEPPRKLAETLIRDHLEVLALSRDQVVASAVGVTTGEVREARRVIVEQLRPWPGLAVGTSTSTAVRPALPEVIITAPRQGGLTVTIRRRVAAPVRLNPWYVACLERPAFRGRLPEPELRQIEHDVASARGFIGFIERRTDTIRRVAEAAVRRQTRFVLNGPGEHLPLNRTDVALELELHPSTVSRAVAGKSAQFPNGSVVPLSAFFGSATSVREALRGLLAANGHTCTDQQIAARLVERGFPVARRTVAKYRAQLGVRRQDGR
jgi:RNA polymerase sigma-54 factor